KLCSNKCKRHNSFNPFIHMLLGILSSFELFYKCLFRQQCAIYLQYSISKNEVLDVNSVTFSSYICNYCNNVRVSYINCNLKLFYSTNHLYLFIFFHDFYIESSQKILKKESSR